MKTLLIASLLVLGVATGVQAQEHREPDWNRLAKHLDVTESQLPAFQAIMQEQSEKRRALHEQIRAQHQALAEEQRSALETVLTPEQLEKMDDLKDRRRDGWKARLHDRQGDGTERKFRHKGRNAD